MNEQTRSNEKEYFCECKGKQRITESKFLSKHPWLLPFHIESFEMIHLKEIFNTIPHVITVKSNRYKLVGFTMLHTTKEHLTSVFLWKDKAYYYDSIGRTDAVRLKPIKDSDYEGQKGSFLYFLLL